MSSKILAKVFFFFSLLPGYKMQLSSKKSNRKKLKINNNKKIPEKN